LRRWLVVRPAHTHLGSYDACGQSDVLPLFTTLL